MLVGKYSAIGKKHNYMDLNITEEQWQEYNSPSRRLIQEIFPNLTPGEREFLITGLMPEDWDKLFGDE